MGSDKLLGLNEFLLWDVDLDNFDPQSYQEFLAARIAEHGKLNDIKWYFENFNPHIFFESVEHSTECSSEVKSFWKSFKDLYK